MEQQVESYQTETEDIKTEASDNIETILIKEEQDEGTESTDSADESKMVTESIYLPETILACKTSFIPTQSQTMTIPHDSNPLQDDVAVADRVERQAEYVARRTLEKNKDKIRSLHRKNRLLKRKLERVNKVFEELGKQCNIAEVCKQLSSMPSDDLKLVSEDSSTESDVEEPYRIDKNLEDNIRVDVITNNQDGAVADNEEINCFNMESQVQVTFLAGSDTAKEGLLKRKLKQLAENDVIKSKKIRELHNIVFVKNKVITELKNELAQLKEFQKNQVQRPVIQYIVRNN